MPLSPLLSVVIPLYDKRVEEEACLESWCLLQTLDRDSFEVIVTSNGEGPKAEERVRQYLKSPDRLVARPGSNMAGLYHAGAEASAAPLIFFTELHCIAEPECLKELLCYLEGKEMAGACVSTYGDYSNVFSSVEAELFDAMFEEWITQNTSKRFSSGEWRSSAGPILKREDSGNVTTGFVMVEGRGITVRSACLFAN